MAGETLSVRAARDEYLRENGFTVEAYDTKWTDASFLGVRIAVPNTPAHRWGIMMHDLHHVATGFGTDIAGEGEISAWELRRGLEGLGLYVASLVITGTLVGLLVAPKRTLRAFRAAGEGRSLFDRELPYDELLALDVHGLRDYLAVPAEGIATTRSHHAYAPVETASAR